MFFLIIFSVDSLLYRNAVDDNLAFFVPAGVSLLLWGYFARHELLQLRATRFLIDSNSRKRFLVWKHLFGLGIWNSLDCFTLLTILAHYIARAVEYSNESYDFFWSGLLLGVALPCIYLNR